MGFLLGLRPAEIRRAGQAVRDSARDEAPDDDPVSQLGLLAYAMAEVLMDMPERERLGMLCRCVELIRGSVAETSAACRGLGEMEAAGNG